jgi:hypothetical protein
VYFFAGVGIGASGLEAGLFATSGKLAERWFFWVATALLGFVLWIIPTALERDAASAAFPGLQLFASAGFVISSTTACFALAATFLRRMTTPSRILGRLSENAYGIYVLHYLFVIWLQYLLLDLPLFAVIKSAIVFSGALLMSWAAMFAGSRALLATGLRRPSAVRPSGSDSRTVSLSCPGPNIRGTATAENGALEEHVKIQPRPS